MTQYRSAHQLRRANRNSDSDSGGEADDSDVEADADSGGETCTTVKSDGEVCGRELPCPYHTESEE